MTDKKLTLNKTPTYIPNTSYINQFLVNNVYIAYSKSIKLSTA